MKKLLVLFSLVLVLFSCSTDENSPFGAYEKGGFAVFADQVIQTAALNAGKFTADVKDVNNNITSYKIVSMKANVGGVVYGPEAVSLPFALPGKVELTFAQLATIFGFPVSDVTYGDSFSVIAEVTTKEGKVFRGEIPQVNGTIPSNNNNTSQNLLTTGNFKSAMAFSFTVACPSYNQASMLGSYTITDGSWDDYSSFTPPGFTVQCVNGPSPNTLRFVNFTNQGRDLIVTINPSSQTATSPLTVLYNPYSGNPPAWVELRGEGRSGLVFSCIGVVKLKFSYSVAIGSFGGTYDFVLTKNP